MIDFENLTACGGDCTGCQHFICGECIGCNKNGGECIKMWQNGCEICRCCKEHGVRFCGICENFPCDWLEKTLVWEENGIERLKILGENYKENLEKAISRIKLMEYYFDAVSRAVEIGDGNILNSCAVKEMMQELKNYYENGLWQSDYETDERGEIPKSLKRGVLSQDGLYDLLEKLF